MSTYKKHLSKITIFVILLTACTTKHKEDSTVDPLSFFNNPRQEIKPKFELLPLNDIKPTGWIKTIMEEDITNGFVAHLDKLAPKLMSDDLFNTAQRKDNNDLPDVGTQTLTGADWEISMQWWGGETQGNWWDGYLRHAYMTHNETAISKIDNIVKYLLSTQDKDGYLGIYTKQMRYQHEGSNGELWTQTTLFRMLLGYYEFTKEKEVLDAVEKAMAVTMTNYNENKKSPFDVKIDYGGVSHGLMMTDVCETLYRLTKNKKYADYAIFLYQNFSKHPINRAFNDVRYESIMAVDSLFQSHSAHTYEHLRTLLLAYQMTGYTELEKAHNIAMKKLRNCILPSGAGFGNEWLNSEKSDPDLTAAEYCGMTELSHFYTSAFQKTGDIQFADYTEKITFNAMQGARNQGGKGITYCKTDNCYILNKKSPQSDFEEDDMRYKYSPTHADAAVCCNPSYGRNLPYFVRNMWMKAEGGLAAVLYGPSRLKTEYEGTEVEIEAITNYPLSDEINFVFTMEKALDFKIYLRKPNWSKNLIIEIEDAEITQKEGFYIVKKTWKTGDKMKVSFQNEIQTARANNDEVFLQRGPIVYALEIPHREEILKNYELKGFKDYLTFPVNDAYQFLSLQSTKKNTFYGFKYIKEVGAKHSNPWYAGNTYLTGKLYNEKEEKLRDVKLKPMGSTVLRKVTFSVEN